MSNITIVIQGPPSEISLKHIDNYRKYGEVIYSTYQPMPKIDGLKTVIGNWYNFPVYNFGNVAKQVFTTLNGLQVVDTEYVIKVRTDEYYTNLNPFISKMLDNKDKYITNNIFFKGAVEPLHPSDHMVGGRTELLLTGFSRIRDLLFTIMPENRHLSGNDFGIPSLNFSSQTYITKSK
jgi:hypothetical protein